MDFLERSVELAAAMTEVPLEEAMRKVEPLQVNVVDLSQLQLGQGCVQMTECLW